MMTDPEDLRMTTREKNPAVRRETCGTYAGWQAHQKRYEIACMACQEANATHVRVWRINTGRTQALSIPLSVLQAAFGAPDGMVVVAEFLGESVCEAVLSWTDEKTN